MQTPFVLLNLIHEDDKTVALSYLQIEAVVPNKNLGTKVVMASGRAYVVKQPFPVVMGLKAEAQKAAESGKVAKPGKEDIKPTEPVDDSKPEVKEPTEEELAAAAQAEADAAAAKKARKTAAKKQG